MKHPSVHFILMLIFISNYPAYCMQKYPSKSNVTHVGLEKGKSGSDSSVDSTGLDPDTFIKKVKEFDFNIIPENPKIRDSLEDLTAKEVQHLSSKLEPITEEDYETKRNNPLLNLFQRRSRSVPCAPTIDTSSLSQGGVLPEKTAGIHIIFQEFLEPSTPTTQQLDLFGLPLKLTHTDKSVSITFMPQGGAYTPTKNSIDFGDKTGDPTYDELKKNLPNNPAAPLALLTALLAKKLRLYLACEKASNRSDTLEVIRNLAQRHAQVSIVKIISEIEECKNYNKAKFESYDKQLCMLQKPAEGILRNAGLQLLRPRSQDC